MRSVSIDEGENPKANEREYWGERLARFPTSKKGNDSRKRDRRIQPCNIS
jgi:hypothetical protein